MDYDDKRARRIIEESVNHLLDCTEELKWLHEEAEDCLPLLTLTSCWCAEPEQSRFLCRQARTTIANSAAGQAAVHAERLAGLTTTGISLRRMN